MKEARYDQQTAQRLLPLLRSIVGEIRERQAELRSLSVRLRTLIKLGDEGRERTDVQARLSLNKRELGAADKELTRLGCTLDPVWPTLVHVRAADESTAAGEWVLDTGSGAEALKLAS